MSGLRPLLRKLAYRSGAMDVARSRLSPALTVIMLHRVIDPADPDFAAADPAYTVSLPLFVSLLAFLQAHYEIVSLARVMAAYDGTEALPDHALLITFDDGWADNIRYAAPALKSLKIPAVVFAVAEAVRSSADAWWQEEVFAAGRNGTLCEWVSACAEQGLSAATSTSSERLAFDTVTKLALMDPTERERLLLALPRSACRRRMMLTPQELSQLSQFGIDVGVHGYNHVPLTASPDVPAELSRARAEIDEMTAGTAVGTALGCPHGRYDSKVVQGARDAGIKLVFTSDRYLNATQGGMLHRDQVFGRIDIAAAHIEDRPGSFDPSAAARWLWAREVR